ncbi:uncharacterized protein F4812DRAFT_363138 [Daldinia caldariorum]|uniref:uncharacterized protein n=1 Tax=Daldinia caldariorum TaxID=326644 RepID=UPI00200867FA|nr:uncharacterized protein F4812DRAFT_363138 [Daldinia caldariorum]KAI1468338.1 hypothetical protein F4812DRAFT_363138 [Daldinia caldariorum]
MKTSTSLFSVFISICLAGVQAELPYNIPEWRREASPPIVPSEHSTWQYHHHKPTGTGEPHHPHPTSVYLPLGRGSHHRPHPTSYPQPTGTASPHYPCKTADDCVRLSCTQHIPRREPTCVQSRVGKFCSCIIPGQK